MTHKAEQFAGGTSLVQQGDGAEVWAGHRKNDPGRQRGPGNQRILNRVDDSDASPGAARYFLRGTTTANWGGLPC